MKKVLKAINSKQTAYISFILACLSYLFISSATWAYGWIAELYPLGSNFIPTLKGVIIVCAVISFIVMIAGSVEKNKSKVFLNIIFLIAFILSIITFVYGFVLIFSLDSGFTSSGFVNGFSYMLSNLPYTALAAAFGVLFLISKSKKEIIISVISSLVIAGIVLSSTLIVSNSNMNTTSDLQEMTFESQNALVNAEITFESLKKGEKPDAENLLADNSKCWTPCDPNRSPEEGYDDSNNSVVEIKLAHQSEINTALIEEVGNEVQYFRLQAFVDGEWKTIYQSEKIQSQRLCSFDAVTTDCIRLSIDKFRNADTPAKIKSIKLYNEPARNLESFEVTAYQRLDSDVPTEILAKGDEYVKNYARYYDVYSTVIVFAAVHWDENGNIGFGESSEEKFAEEIDALKKIIDNRSNKDHQVKLIVTALADGAWGDEHNGVNVYMAKYWQSIADQIVDFTKKYSFDGVDIDWEYPQTADDWKIYDSFIARLDDGLKADKPDAIISSALSSWNLGMSKDTLDRLDQIQFMAYDGNDEDGYQSSLQQAQEGLKAFADNGADISKINIGIAAYGRPVNGSPYWAIWRTLPQANYWDSKYYNVLDGNQIYDGTFCSPALAGDKTAYAMLSGAGGVMVFRVGSDKTMDDPNSVACGIENALNRYCDNW